MYPPDFFQRIPHVELEPEGQPDFDYPLTASPTSPAPVFDVPTNNENLLGGFDVDGRVILTDHQIQKRVVQVEIGKKTTEYQNYIQKVPREERGPRGVHPRTPDPKERISKRRFWGKLRVWRTRLHELQNAEIALKRWSAGVPMDELNANPNPSQSCQQNDLQQTQSPQSPPIDTVESRKDVPPVDESSLPCETTKTRPKET